MAFKHFVIAYRIDKEDERLQDMKELMRELQQDVELARKKVELGIAMRKKYNEGMRCAKKKMEEEKYSVSIVCWDQV